MDRPGLTELTAFAAIASRASFRIAAGELGVSPSTLSHLMRALEQRLGVRLLHRTTRSVAPTAAGQRLLARLEPVLRDLDLALAEVDDARATPRGSLRISVAEAAARYFLDRVVPVFIASYPGVELELVEDNHLVDIVAHGFDAGVRLREAIPQDMIAVPFGGPMRFVIVGAPSYLARHPAPRRPADLARHRCIAQRFESGRIYHWELEKRGREHVIEVPATLTLNKVELMTLAAVRGIGLAFVPAWSARPHLDAGRLVEVLADWCPPLAGSALYYPGHRHVPASLRAFIDVLKAQERPARARLEPAR